MSDSKERRLESARTGPGPLRELYGLLTRAQRRRLGGVLLLMAAGVAAELVTIGAVVPFLAAATGRAADSGLGGALAPFTERVRADVGPAATLLIGAAITAALLRMLLVWSGQKLALSVSHDLGVRMYARALRQPYSHYMTRSTSELIAGFEKIRLVSFGVLLPVMHGAIAALTALGIAALLFLIQPIASLLAAVSMTAVYVAITLATAARLRRNSVLLATTATQRVSVLREGMGGIRDILLDGSQPVFEERFRTIDSRHRAAQVVNGTLAAAPRHLVEAAGITLLALAGVWTSRQPGGIVAAMPVLGAFAIGIQRLLPLMQQTYAGWTQLAAHTQPLRDVVALLHAPVVASASAATREVAFEREIRFDGVGFDYPQRERTLRDVSVRIAKGARIGVVGRSGSGKSTFVDLLLGLLQPTSGRILIDDEPLDAGACASWQARSAHVPQHIYLADRSIAANVAFMEAEAVIDLARVRDAARVAQLDAFVASLPDGYGTVVGEHGIRLSAGQRQRIGIARALYKRPALLVLDEATSALDAQTEAAVLRTITAALPDTTLVVVTHRAAALEICNSVLRFEGGRIIARRRASVTDARE